MQVIHGDCLDVLRGMPDASVDAVVSDPPYELAFMGRKWDASGIAYSVDLWREVLRVLKPGGHCLAFGATRTYHRMTVAIEDAGFEVRDSIHWMYGQGFPKSHNLPGGLGTALKPAHEPIVVARKPLIGTVAANVEQHGCGALNIDGCRVEGVPRTTHADGNRVTSEAASGHMARKMPHGPTAAPPGRWPPNVLLTHSADCVRVGERTIVSRGGHEGARDEARVSYAGGLRVRPHQPTGVGSPKEGTTYMREEFVPAYQCADDCPVALLDRQSGERRSAYPNNPHAAANYAGTDVAAGCFGGDKAGASYSDSGGASRFFPTFEWDPFLYQAKASKRDRGEGNKHPTVKPTALMRWLIRLVTPKGGTVLDPFAGSGTTLVAAQQEGMSAIGIEREAEYVEIIHRRLGMKGAA